MATVLEESEVLERELHPYQWETVDFVMDRWFIHDQLGSGIFADPGLGKTLMTLMILEQLRCLGELDRVLIIAPLRVVYSVWPAEIKKWGFDFDVSIVHGSAKARRKALNAEADIYLINPEGLPWLKEEGLAPSGILIVDESTKFKSWSTERMRALRKLLPKYRRRLILTGTPAPNSLADLFAQMYIVDNGDTLGKTESFFRQRWMSLGGYQGRQWEFDERLTSSMYKAISPMIMRLDAKDHLDMPPIIYNDVWIDLPPNIQQQYNEYEQQLFTELDSGVSLTASSFGAKYMACRGIANGGVYVKLDEEGRHRETHHIHDAKVDAIQDIREELFGKPVLVAYQFQHDLERLRKHFPETLNIGGGIKAKTTDGILSQWNNGELDALLVQPQAMSHGVNMQACGNDILWMGCPDQLEIYTQFNARLWRQGVRDQVRIHHILARNTIDEAVIDRIRRKANTQADLLDSLNDYRRKKDARSE